MFSMLRVKINFAGAEVNRKREREKFLTPVWSKGTQDFLELKQWNITRNPLNLHHESKILAWCDKEMRKIISIYAGDVQCWRAKRSERGKFFTERKIVVHGKRGKFWWREKKISVVEISGRKATWDEFSIGDIEFDSQSKSLNFYFLSILKKI